MKRVFADSPDFTMEQVLQICEERFGISGRVEKLPSERDRNFLVESSTGETFVFKVANSAESRGMLEAQQQALNLVSSQTALCPGVVPSLSGETIIEIVSNSGKPHSAWMITYIRGTLMAHSRRLPLPFFRDLGGKLARIDQALSGFDHSCLHREFHWDLASGPGLVRESSCLIGDESLRTAVESMIARFDSLEALVPELPRSAIYNDANDYNIIVRDSPEWISSPMVAGFVDFGDMVHSVRVADPAVAAAYAVLDRENPLQVAAEILAGYHAENPLLEKEAEVFFDLLCLRLCMSACIAAKQIKENPDNQYLAVSQEPILRTLPLLGGIHQRWASVFFRAACGMDPDLKSMKIVQWLHRNRVSFQPILGEEFSMENFIWLDLGISGSLLEGTEMKNEAAMLHKIQETLAGNPGAVPHGTVRWLPMEQSESLLGREAENLQLGLKFFLNSEGNIAAPFPGKVYLVSDGRSGDPSGLILEHSIDETHTFFTIYRGGDPLVREAGVNVEQGVPLLSVSRSSENGPAHFHFQVVTDLLGLGLRFPEKVRPSEKDVWGAFSPDPSIPAGIPAEKPRSDPSRVSDTLERRRSRIGGSVRLSYSEPLKIVRGWMQYLFDEQGRRYLDSYNNVPHVGHCHPRVVEAARRQIGILNTNTRYLHDAVNEYAGALTAQFPEPLKVCFFLNSASEANELAIRLARIFTGKRDMLVLEAAYHGHTTSLIDISPYKHNGPGGAGAPEWVHACPLADDYRGPFKRSDPLAGEKYAAMVERTIMKAGEKGRGIAAFIAESCPSVGGQIYFPPGYLSGVYKAVRAAGGLCIADEVQTGFGRIGTHFWAFQSQEVVPDIVVLGKPIGNGHPLAAVITTPEIAAAFDNGMEFFSTFGGNTVSVTVGKAVLQVVLEEELQDHALKVGETLLERLRPMRERFPLVGDVRGSGLFLGMELVRNRETLEPAAEEASYIVNRMREQGILFGTDGPLHNVLKIRPPMPFNEANVMELADTLEGILADLTGGITWNYSATTK